MIYDLHELQLQKISSSLHKVHIKYNSSSQPLNASTDRVVNYRRKKLAKLKTQHFMKIFAKCTHTT